MELPLENMTVLQLQMMTMSASFLVEALDEKKAKTKWISKQQVTSAADDLEMGYMLAMKEWAQSASKLHVPTNLKPNTEPTNGTESFCLDEGAEKADYLTGRKQRRSFSRQH